MDLLTQIILVYSCVFVIHESTCQKFDFLGGFDYDYDKQCGVRENVTSSVTGIVKLTKRDFYMFESKVNVQAISELCSIDLTTCPPENIYDSEQVCYCQNKTGDNYTLFIEALPTATQNGKTLQTVIPSHQPSKSVIMAAEVDFAQPIVTLSEADLYLFEPRVIVQTVTDVCSIDLRSCSREAIPDSNQFCFCKSLGDQYIVYINAQATAAHNGMSLQTIIPSREPFKPVMLASEVGKIPLVHRVNGIYRVNGGPESMLLEGQNLTVCPDIYTVIEICIKYRQPGSFLRTTVSGDVTSNGSCIVVGRKFQFDKYLPRMLNFDYAENLECSEDGVPLMYLTADCNSPQANASTSILSSPTPTLSPSLPQCPPTEETVPEVRIIVTEGQRVSLECNIDELKTPHIAHTHINWKHPKHVSGYHSMKSDKSATLVFSRVKGDYGGHFECWSTDINNCNIYPIKNVSVIVSGPPKVTHKEPNWGLKAVEKTRRTISCVVAAAPAVTNISWSLNDNSININSGRYEGGTLKHPSLIITSIEPKDDGAYKCFATNTYGTGSFRYPARLTVSYAPRIIYNESTTFSKRVGHWMRLPCLVSSNPRPTEVRWKRILGNESFYLERTKQIVRRKENTYYHYINKLQDEAAEGTYSCEADNDYGSAYGLPLKVVVKPCPPITVLPEYVTRTEGQLLVLPCKVTKAHNMLPISNMYWGNKATNERYIWSQRVDQLTARYNVYRYGDRTRYECWASDGTCEILVRNVTLILNYAPHITVSSRTIIAHKGENITLMCDVDAVPEIISLTWTKAEHGALNPTSDPSKYSGGTVSDTSLVIIASVEADSGTYSCEATNSLGTKRSRDVRVRVPSS